MGYGARYPGWRNDFSDQPLLKFIAMQWSMSVKYALDGLLKIPANRQILVRYEDLLREPERELARIFQFIGAGHDYDFPAARKYARADNINKWKKAFNDDEIASIQPIMDEWLDRLGYV